MEKHRKKPYFIRGLAVAAGIFMVGIAVGFFKVAEMGADPFTAMNTGIQWKIIGIGTGILAFCTGPLIQFFRVHWSDKMLKRYCGKGEAAK